MTSYKNTIINKGYNTILCQNCGEKGHHVKDCVNPRTSLGVVLFRKINDNYEYLMICRRNTIGFVEFIRGKYVYSDTEYLKDLFRVMTNYEINLIINNNFEYLWEYLWMDNKFNNKNNSKLKKNYNAAYEKFSKINNGYIVNGVEISTNILYNNRKSGYFEPEWGFPKGRRSYNESDYVAALREFNEETLVSENDIKLISNVKTFIEIYKSYDNVCYKNIYYLAEYKGQTEIYIDENNKTQYTEVSNIGFFNINDALIKIRDYNVDKKNILKEINEYLTSA